MLCFLFQRVDEFLAEVDAARDVARKAVESGEKTLREANETLETLLGKGCWCLKSCQQQRMYQGKKKQLIKVHMGH